MQADLDGRPVALFGSNGAGKTNVLEAISLLSPGRGMRRARAEDIARRPEALGWKVRASLQGPDGVHEIETVSEAGRPRSVRIDDKTAPQTALGHLARVLWLIPSMDRLWIEGAEGRRRFLDRATLSFEPGHAEAVLVYEKAMRQRNRLLKDHVADPHWYAALEAQMAERGAQIMGNRALTLARLADEQGTVESGFPTAILKLRYPDSVSELGQGIDALRAGFAENRRRDMAAGRSLSGPHRVDLDATYAAKGVAARECSTGEQKALLISLILANARVLAREFGAPPILLLDEVAAHLDSDRRGMLFDEVCALGAQAFMTGTGSELFTQLGRRAQYFEVIEAEPGSSLVSREAPYES